jgi:hypothetical protein
MWIFEIFKFINYKAFVGKLLFFDFFERCCVICSFDYFLTLIVEYFIYLLCNGCLFCAVLKHAAEVAFLNPTFSTAAPRPGCMP